MTIYLQSGQRRRKFSKSARPEDYAGFEQEEDVQDAADEEEQDEDEEKSDAGDSEPEEVVELKRSIDTIDIENIPPFSVPKKADEPLDKLRFFQFKYHNLFYERFYRRLKSACLVLLLNDMLK